MKDGSQKCLFKRSRPYLSGKNKALLGSWCFLLLIPGCLLTHHPGDAVQTIPQVVVPQAAAPTIIIPPASAPPSAKSPVVTSQAAILIEAESGRPLYSKQARTRRAVASTQKLLTALVVLEAQRSGPVVVPAVATAVEPSKLYLRAGDEYEQSQLVKALLVKSANDVATALSVHVSGSQEAFMEVMNQKAQTLGMKDSFFLNPHGLTESGQYSTAYDVALLARQAYQNPSIREYIATPSMTFVYADGRTKALRNTNRLLRTLSYCTGMKTGTTRASGFCLVSSGTLKGRTCFAVVLGAPSRAVLYEESQRLLRWGLER